MDRRATCAWELWKTLWKRWGEEGVRQITDGLELLSRSILNFPPLSRTSKTSLTTSPAPCVTLMSVLTVANGRTTSFAALSVNAFAFSAITMLVGPEAGATPLVLKALERCCVKFPILWRFLIVIGAGPFCLDASGNVAKDVTVSGVDETFRSVRNSARGAMED